MIEGRAATLLISGAFASATQPRRRRQRRPLRAEYADGMIEHDAHVGKPLKR